MDNRSILRITDRIPAGSRRFFIIELTTHDERIIPGLIRFRLESVLPHGIQGFTYYYTQVPGTDRYLATVLRSDREADYALDRLPFSLSLSTRESQIVLWRGEKESILCGYEKGKLVSVEERRLIEAPLDSTVRQLSFLEHGPAIQASPLSRRRVTGLIALTLTAMLVIQAAFLGWSAIALRSQELDGLRSALRDLQVARGSESQMLGAQASEDKLLRAGDQAYRDIAGHWLPHYYLTRWRLSEKGISIEGWGPSSLQLLAELKKAPSLGSLKLMSTKTAQGSDYFTFTGELFHD